MSEYTTKKKQSGHGDNSAAVQLAAQQTTNGIPNSMMQEVLSGRRRATNDMVGHRQNLAPSVQAKMSRAFGMDFSGVQLYRTDAMEGTGMRGVSQGNRVVLGNDVNLNTLEGQTILGHELSHVRAQSMGIGMGHSGLLNDASLEHQADVEGSMAARGLSVGQEGMTMGAGLSVGLGMAGIGGLTPIGGGISTSAAAPMQAWGFGSNKPGNKASLASVDTEQDEELYHRAAPTRNFVGMGDEVEPEEVDGEIPQSVEPESQLGGIDYNNLSKKDAINQYKGTDAYRKIQEELPDYRAMAENKIWANGLSQAQQPEEDNQSQLDDDWTVVNGYDQIAPEMMHKRNENAANIQREKQNAGIGTKLWSVLKTGWHGIRNTGRYIGGGIKKAVTDAGKFFKNEGASIKKYGKKNLGLGALRVLGTIIRMPFSLASAALERAAIPLGLPGILGGRVYDLGKRITYGKNGGDSDEEENNEQNERSSKNVLLEYSGRMSRASNAVEEQKAKAWYNQKTQEKGKKKGRFGRALSWLGKASNWGWMIGSLFNLPSAAASGIASFTDWLSYGAIGDGIDSRVNDDEEANPLKHELIGEKNVNRSKFSANMVPYLGEMAIKKSVYGDANASFTHNISNKFNKNEILLREAAEMNMALGKGFQDEDNENAERDSEIKEGEAVRDYYENFGRNSLPVKKKKE